MILATVNEVASLIAAVTGLVAALGAIASTVLGKGNKAKIEPIAEQVDEVHQEVTNGGSSHA